MTERIRTTISVPQDVYEVFKQMAGASGTSVSRCMGDWLAETAEGAQHVSMKLQRARELSKGAIKELHAALRDGDVVKLVIQMRGRSWPTSMDWQDTGFEPENCTPAEWVAKMNDADPQIEYRVREVSTAEDVDSIATKKASPAAAGSRRTPQLPATPTPYSNTGLKSPAAGKMRGGKSS